MIDEKKYIVTVLMPAYNAELYIEEAIRSILNQTFKEFEFLIINDGSTDSTETIVRKYSDPRIIFITNESNKGLIYSLNYGLRIARGKYIARMDADDICFPKRLEKEVSYMEKHPEISLLGSNYIRMDNNEEICHPSSWEQIRLYLLEGTTFAHPTVMIRKDDFFKHELSYQEKDFSAEDYGLWVAAAKRGLKMANLSDFLLLYRIHDDQISTIKAVEQRETTRRIRMEYARFYWKDKLSEGDYYIISRLFEDSEAYLSILTLWKLWHINKTDNIFEEQEFKYFLAKYFDKSYKNMTKWDLFQLIKLNFTFNYKLYLIRMFIKKTYVKYKSKLQS